MIENEKFYLKDQVKQVLKGEQTSIGKLKYQKKHKMTNFTLHKAIFNWVSKVIRDCISIILPRYVICPENSRRSLNQLDAKLKPIRIDRPRLSAL